MGLKPATIDLSALRLTPFRPEHADRVASWIQSPEEAYWVAPKDVPPIGPEQVRAWGGPGREPLLLVDGSTGEPVAYGELNLLRADEAEYWLGHLVVSPAFRGRGVGRLLTRHLLSRARRNYAARRVSLVVFPENRVAIACYQAVGFRSEGWEVHELRPYRRRVRLLRMSYRMGD